MFPYVMYIQNITLLFVKAAYKQFITRTVHILICFVELFQIVGNSHIKTHACCKRNTLAFAKLAHDQYSGLID